MPAVANHIVKWLKDYATNANVNGFVVGVSGGIDSAVVSKLCAMTGLRTVCVVMPIAQKTDEVKRAHKHIDTLVRISEEQLVYNVDVAHYDLTSVYEHMMLALNDVNSVFTHRMSNSPYKGLEQKVNRDIEFLSRANTRARLRMSTLYYLATKHKLLVAGTGNRVEDFGVGFFTKYGDGGVDLSPIADLNKTEVYELGKALGIISDIQEAQPTDGLWDDGRTDEDQIGATYAELEWAMQFIDDNPFYRPDDLEELTERQREVLVIYKTRNSANKHKMNPIPVCEVRGNHKLLILDEETKALIDELRQIKEDKNRIVRNQKYEEAAKMRDKEKAVIEKLFTKGIKA